MVAHAKPVQLRRLSARSYPVGLGRPYPGDWLSRHNAAVHPRSRYQQANPVTVADTRWNDRWRHHLEYALCFNACL